MRLAHGHMWTGEAGYQTANNSPLYFLTAATGASQVEARVSLFLQKKLSVSSKTRWTVLTTWKDVLCAMDNGFPRVCGVVTIHYVQHLPPTVSD